MADANPDSQPGHLLPQFKRWYSQPAHRVCKASGTFDAAAQTYTLHFTQSCAATAGQPDKAPFVIPVLLGLVGTAVSRNWHCRCRTAPMPRPATTCL
jgi:aminopeptidase N